MIIAIDGPAGSGKSTTARRVAESLGFIYVDTGAMYRAITLAVLREKIGINEQELSELLPKYSVSLAPSAHGQRTFLNGEDVSEEIRKPDVTQTVSAVSAFGVVREAMVREQKELGKHGGIVMDGRDIGTKVFPSAEVKIFMTASPDKRAIRRLLELQSKNIAGNFEEIREQIIVRDAKDSERELSPLRQADDAVSLDTSDMTIDEQTEFIIALARERMA